jgi:hypothetical protein
MPLKLNVGLSRKVGEADYGSRGASVNIEMELESSLVGEPAKLQERIRQIFGIVRTSLAEELNGNGQAHGNGRDKNGAPAATTRTTNGGGDTVARPATTSRAATQSQIRAIHAITKDQGIKLARLLRGRYQVDRPEDLGIKQASELIDSLKSDKNREEA